MPTGYLSVTLFGLAAGLDTSDPAMLSQNEAHELLTPYYPLLIDIHRRGYDERQRTIEVVPGRWAAQDARTQGAWTRNLILHEVDNADLDACLRSKDGAAEVIRVFNTDGVLAAQLRLRKVELFVPEGGIALEPRIPTPSSDVAKKWFGNTQLRPPFQDTLFEDVKGLGSHTNLLVGRTESPIGEFERLYLACYTGTRVAWHYEIPQHEADVTPLTSRKQPEPAAPAAKRAAVGIKRKESSS